MRGKDKCKMLKEIRARIAEENDIQFITSECTHQGECRGTCPKCEAELRQLEAALEQCKSSHKRVALAGLAVSMTLSTSACSVIEDVVDDIVDEIRYILPRPTEDIQVMGEFEMELMGDVPDYTDAPFDDDVVGLIEE